MPAGWNELSTSQFRFLVRLVLLGKSRATFLALMVEHLLGLKRSYFVKLNPEAVAVLGESVAFLTDGPKDIMLTKQHHPVAGGLYAMDDGLIDASFEQFFEYTEPAFVRYMQGDKEMLRYLWAVCHVRRRGLFVPADIEGIRKVAEKQSDYYLPANLMFYSGCRNFIMKKFPKVFTGEGKAPNGDGLEFMRLLATLNNKDLSRNPAIRGTNLYEAMIFMQGIIENGKGKMDN